MLFGLAGMLLSNIGLALCIHFAGVSRVVSLSSVLFAVLFLGGWRGPASEWTGWLWTVVKALPVAFLILWIRVAWPRVREDQLQRLAWLGLVPVALAQLALTAVVVVAR